MVSECLGETVPPSRWRGDNCQRAVGEDQAMSRSVTQKKRPLFRSEIREEQQQLGLSEQLAGNQNNSAQKS